MNKSDSVRAALRSLGRDATPGEVQEWIRGQGGPEVSPGLVYQIRTKFSREPRAAAKTAANGSSVPSVRPEDVRKTVAMVKELVRHSGSVQAAHEWVDLVGEWS